MMLWRRRILRIATIIGALVAAIVTFETTTDWQEYEYPCAAFSGIDGSDLTGVLFSGPRVPGPFRLEIDDAVLG